MVRGHGRRPSASGAATSPTSARRPRSTATWPAGGRARSGRSCSASPTPRSATPRTGRELLGDDVGPRAARRPPDAGAGLAGPAVRVGVRAGAGAARREPVARTTPTPTRRPAMAADERIHEEVVRGLAARGRARVSGTFRAAVFGANDGLVSNLALVLGVSGGGASPQRRAAHRAGRAAGRRAVDGRRRVRLGPVPARAAGRVGARAGRTHGGARTSTSTPTSSPWSTGPADARRRGATPAPTPCCAALSAPARTARRAHGRPATTWSAPGSAPRCRASASSPPAPRCRCCRSCSG